MDLDNICSNVLTTNSSSSVILLLRCDELYQTKSILECEELLDWVSSTYKETFPIQLELVHSYTKIGQIEKAYDKLCDCLNLFPNISFPKLESVWRLYPSTLTKNIQRRYISYPHDIVEMLNKKRKVVHPRITVTMTTCKRFSLFKDSINSFLTCCKDLDKIDRWICIDDNSSEQDRVQMRVLYPFFEFIFKRPEEKGHARSLNILLSKVKSPYILHLEDDWVFIEKYDYITKALDCLGGNPMILQCLFNLNYSETEEHLYYGGISVTTESGNRFILHEHADTKSPLYSTLLNKLNNIPNCVYWPHFSLRPGLYKRSLFDMLGRFNENVSHFERQYANQYESKGYLTCFFPKITSIHTGRLTCEIQDITRENAYSLNDEKQFSGKIDANGFSCRILSLDRRTDRWNAFQKNNKDFISFLSPKRVSSVDGLKSRQSPRLQYLFEPNDYKMRRGIVGCALSHLRLWIDFIQKDSDKKYLVVFEDDAKVTSSFQVQFTSIINTLEAHDSECDLLFLSHIPNPSNPNPIKKGQNILMKKTAKESIVLSLGGTHSYMITQRGAKRLLDFIEQRGMTNAIDTMQQLSADVVEVRYLSDEIVECPGQEDSDIQGKFDHSLWVDDSVCREMFEKNGYKVSTSGLQRVHPSGLFLTDPDFHRLMNSRGSFDYSELI